MQSTIQIRVRYAETDQMRRAYHANYLIWFEAARINLMREYGISYASLEKEGYYLPVVQAHVNYRSPANFDDLIMIEARIEKQPKAKITINYQVKNENGQLIADGFTLHSFMNEDGKPVRPPQRFTTIVSQNLAENKNAG